MTVKSANLLNFPDKSGIALAEYLPNPFYTTGVANIEKRYSSGGGAPNHTPGSATKLGHPEHVEGNVEKSKGMGTPHWEEHIGGQKPEVRDENVRPQFISCRQRPG